MERLASPTGLLPEQVWDGQNRPEAHMYFGKPTGSATPLVWAHAEYIKLLRSARDGRIFDLIPEVAERYTGNRSRCKKIEVWKPNRQTATIKKGHVLRIQAPAAFRLHWSRDNWKTIQDSQSTSTSLGIEYVDVDAPANEGSPFRFTFFWTSTSDWEGRDY